MLRFSHIVALLAVLVVAGCCKLPSTAPTEKVYNMNFPADNMPGLRITQVVVNSKETRVKLRFQNTSTQATTISTAPPGHMDTFFIEAADQTRRHGLVRATGISYGPVRDRVAPGATQEFTLYFPPIDASWSPIDLHEGELVKKGVNYWVFTDVPLR
ncbi:MAG: hypothetical protein HY898_07135 [Deltaproteobacteria bacterium]|nr:hypothetical protein [Deltaproteobacteria bacterium]